MSTKNAVVETPSKTIIVKSRRIFGHGALATAVIEVDDPNFICVTALSISCGCDADNLNGHSDWLELILRENNKNENFTFFRSDLIVLDCSESCA